MPDVYVIFSDASLTSAIAGPTPKPFDYYDLAGKNWPGGATMVRFINGDTARPDLLKVYQNSCWVRWEPPLGEQQQAAYEAGMSGRSIFITGPAGTGKTEVVRRIIRDLRAIGNPVAVTATTGIAAINAGGMTIHSCLGTGLSSSIRDARTNRSNGIATAADRLSKVRTIVLDEVSMAHGDYIEMVNWWLQRCAGICGSSGEVPFGGWQMIFLGDFLQLPPVIKKSDSVEYKYAFQAPSWINGGIEVHYLKKGYRQADAEHRQHLMRIRRGHAPQDTLDYFNQRHRQPLEDGVDPTEVFPTNAEADAVNDMRLEAVDAPETVFEVTVSGHEKWIEAMRKNLVCEERLRLKVGAEVLFIKNNRNAGYANGTRGRVVGLDNGVQVRTYDTPTYTGSVIEVPREKWEMRNAQDSVLAVAEQFPLILGWATTSHRQQGSTLDFMRFDPDKTFERAMAYTALSRVRTLAGMTLRNKLADAHVRASSLCVQYYKNLTNA